MNHPWQPDPDRPEQPSGQPVAPMPAGRRRGPRFWWAVGGVAAALAVVLTLVLTLGGRSGPESPREAVEAFVAAMVDGEYSAAYDLMCRDEQEDFGSRGEFVQDALDDPSSLSTQWRVSDVRPLGDDAWAVTVILSALGQTEGGEVLVVEEGGRYRFCGPA